MNTCTTQKECEICPLLVGQTAADEMLYCKPNVGWRCLTRISAIWASHLSLCASTSRHCRIWTRQIGWSYTT